MITDPTQLARLLDQARLEAREVARLTEAAPELSLPEAYQVQAAGVALRVERAERIIGYKMGLTSEAKRKQMNLDRPVYGTLTDAMQVAAGGSFSLAGKIHPKIEPEVAFRTRAALRGRISRDEALAACGEVFPAMEILDSRYVGFKYFSLVDVVADNSSSAYFVCAERGEDPRKVDLANLELTMLVDGRAVATALSSAISGDPVLSVVQLVELLDQQGLSLPSGSVVLAGAATVAEQLKADMKVELRVAGLGSVAVSIRA